jgi:hypothetical protein
LVLRKSGGFVPFQPAAVTRPQGGAPTDRAYHRPAGQTLQRIAAFADACLLEATATGKGSVGLEKILKDV